MAVFVCAGVAVAGTGSAGWRTGASRPLAGGVRAATLAPADDIPGVALAMPSTVTDTLDASTDIDDVYRVHLEVGQVFDAELSAPTPPPRWGKQGYVERFTLLPDYSVPTDTWLDGEMNLTATGVTCTMGGRTWTVSGDMAESLALHGPLYVHLYTHDDYSQAGFELDSFIVDAGPGTTPSVDEHFDSSVVTSWTAEYMDSGVLVGPGSWVTTRSLPSVRPGTYRGSAGLQSAMPVVTSLPARIRFRMRCSGNSYRYPQIRLGPSDNVHSYVVLWVPGSVEHDYVGSDLYTLFFEDALIQDPGPDFDLYLLPPGTPSLATAVPVWGSTTPDTSDEAFTYVARTHGDYYLVVNAYAGSGEYTLSASTRPVDPDFEIPGVAHSLPFADADTLDGLADMQDVRAIYLKAGERVDVLLSGSSGTDFDTYLFGPEATSTAGAVQPLAYSVSDTSSERMSLTARTTGTHYLVVDGRWTAVAGTYTLSAMRGISDPDGDIPGTARTVPFVVNDALDPMLDPHDVSRVYLVQGQRLDASLWFDPGSEFDARLYGPLSTTLAPGLTPLPWTGGAGPSAIQRSWVADRSGYYYLDVSAGVDSPGGLYSLQVTASTPVLSATAISIRSSASSVRYRVPFRLTGVLTPGRMGDPCVVEVRKPGSARWSYSSARLCYSETGAGANWWYRYTPLLRGTYTFRVRFAGDGWRLACRSPNTVAVRVR